MLFVSATFERGLISVFSDDSGNAVNISFVFNAKEFRNKGNDKLVIKVNERGSGWTKSCGSGAAATAAYMIKYGLSPDETETIVQIDQDGGILEVAWDPRMLPNNKHKPLFLFGPSQFEYEGTWND